MTTRKTVRSKRQKGLVVAPKSKRRHRVRIRMTGEFCAKVTAAIKARSEASTNQLASDVGVSAAVVRRALKKLATRGDIVATGDKRKRWRLTKVAPAEPKKVPSGKERFKVIKEETVVGPGGVFRQVTVEKPGAKGSAPAPNLPGRSEVIEKLIESVKAELAYLTSIQLLLKQEDQLTGQLKALLERRLTQVLWK